MKEDSGASDGKRTPRTLNYKRFLPIVGRSSLSLLLIGASVAGVLALGRAERPRRKGPAEKVLPVVEVAAIQSHSGGIDFEVDGVVIPFRQVEVPAEVAGQIDFKAENCRIGRTVKRGELLLSVDPSDFEIEIRRLREELTQAKVNQQELAIEIASRHRQIELAQEDLDIKQREVARYESIDDPGVYSKTELDTARLKELQARDMLQTEHDQLALLEARKEKMAAAVEHVTAQLEKAQLELSRTKIESPLDGVVTQEIAEEGSYVLRGGAVVKIQDTSRMEIRCSLKMREVDWLLRSAPKVDNRASAYHIPETPATVSFKVGGTTYRWQGNLSYFDGGQVDQKTRMIPCRVNIQAPLDYEAHNGNGQLEQAPAALALMAGMFVKVTIHAQPDLALIELPEAAIQPGNTVWTVAPQSTTGKLEQTPIRVVYKSGDSVLAYVDDDSLQPDDLVIVSPLAAPVEGGTVEIMESK